MVQIMIFGIFVLSRTKDTITRIIFGIFVLFAFLCPICKLLARSEIISEYPVWTCTGFAEVGFYLDRIGNTEFYH